MFKRRILVFIIFIAFAAVFPLASVSGTGYESSIFDDTAALYQIKKSVVWAVIITFFAILIMAKIILWININKRIEAEISLMGNEEILRTLINGTPDLVFFKDAEGRYLEINESALEIFGINHKYCKGIEGYKLDKASDYCMEEFERYNNLDEIAWESGSIYRSVDIMNMPDGNEISYDVIRAPIFYKNGKRKGLVVLARDITNYKEAEEKLEEKEKILRATLNATDDGIIVVDNNRQVIEANELYYRMWSIPFDIYSLNNETALLKHIKKQLANPDEFEAWVNFTYEVPVTEHYMAELSDGRIYDVFSTPLMDKGHMIGRVWSYRDITAKVNAEKELQNSEERYRTLVELCPDAIFVNVEEKTVFSNMAGLKMLGAKSREEIYQNDLAGFIQDETKTYTEKYLHGIISNSEKTTTSEHKIKRLDGECVDVEAVCKMVPYRGMNSMMCVVRDISERKRTEEMRRKMDENMKLVRETLQYDKIKTEFFANLSHEIKTPLNIIIGTLQLLELILKREGLEGNQDKLAKYIAIMKQNCFRLLRMHNNLIYITEIDSGFVDMHIKNHDLVEIVKDTVGSAAKFIENKGVTLLTDIGSLRLETACDIDKIERILLNLLSNAVKFTKSGDSITVSLYRKRNFACISVKDTGIGIPEKMKDIIFDRFRQVDKSFTRECEGSGIGLSLVKSLVEMHRGTIEVKSEYGKGSEFIVILPLVQLNDEIAATAEKTASVCIDRVNIEFSDIY